MSFVASPLVSEAHELLQKPLIVGASVSSGYGTEGPGNRLSRRFTKKENIVNIAIPGSTGRSHVPSLKPELVKDRSIIIAMDFLFWDSVYSNSNESLAALDHLIQQGFLEIKGRKYTFKELVPDGLHLVEVAGEFLADRIYALPLFNAH